MTEPGVWGFRSYLLGQRIAHTFKEGAITVLGNLDITNQTFCRLPPGLTVNGILDIRNTPITALPERLRVQGSLRVRQCPLTTLPDDLAVGDDVILTGSPITALPAGLRVQGSLDLAHTPITTLPDRLEVLEYLNLIGTPVQRLPQDLSVGMSIIPPSGLLDMVAFLDTVEGEVSLTLHGSAHHRLELQARLQPYPDLLKVVASAGRQHQIRLSKRPDGQIISKFMRLQD